jgi:hypothetical protein
MAVIALGLRIVLPPALSLTDLFIDVNQRSLVDVVVLHHPIPPVILTLRMLNTVAMHLSFLAIHDDERGFSRGEFTVDYR